MPFNAKRRRVSLLVRRGVKGGWYCLPGTSIGVGPNSIGNHSDIDPYASEWCVVPINGPQFVRRWVLESQGTTGGSEYKATALFSNVWKW